VVTTASRLTCRPVEGWSEKSLHGRQLHWVGAAVFVKDGLLESIELVDYLRKVVLLRFRGLEAA
jgi:hypothetical protein